MLYQRSSTSTSKLNALKTAVTNFVNSVSANAKEYNVEHRIAMVGFASKGTDNSAWKNTGLFVDGRSEEHR